MPIYEYRCASCGHELEALQKFSDAPLVECPACHRAELRKKVSAAGFHLKGSGWYVTDFRNSGAKPKAKEAKEAKEDKEAKEAKDAATETKASNGGDAKTDAKPGKSAPAESATTSTTTTTNTSAGTSETKSATTTSSDKPAT